MAAELVYEALMLMLIGMGSVFAFLFILVMLVHLMSRWLPKSAPTPTPATTTSHAAEAAVPPTVIAAISAAIHQFRQK